MRIYCSIYIGCNWYFPNGIFPEATSQMCNFPSGNFQEVRLGPLRRRKLQWGPALRLGWARRLSDAARTGWGQSLLRFGQPWEVAVWELAHLISSHLGKYPWEVAILEKSFGKVPNFGYINLASTLLKNTTRPYFFSQG